MITNVYWSQCKVAIILTGFEWNLNFRNILSKYTQIPNFMTIHRVGAEYFDPYGGTSMVNPLAPEFPFKF